MNQTQFEEQTQSLYRLRSARNKRRAVIEDRDKMLLELSREQHSLREEQWNQAWEPLDPPYQRGWKRSFILRDDVAQGPAAAFYEDILKLINTTQLSTRRDFKRKKRKHGRKIYVERGQELKRLNLWEWQRIQLHPKQAELFELHEIRRERSVEYHFVFKEPWRFQLRVEKNMITQLRKPLSLVESRLQRISNWLASGEMEHRMYRLTQGNSWRRRFSKPAARNEQALQRFKRTPLQQLLAEAQSSI